MSIWNSVKNMFIIAEDRARHGEAGAMLQSIYNGLTAVTRAWDKAAQAKGLITMDELRKKGAELTENAKNFLSTAKLVFKETTRLVRADESSETNKYLKGAESAANFVKGKVAIGKENAGKFSNFANNFMDKHNMVRTKSMRDGISSGASKLGSWFVNKKEGIEQGLAKGAEEAKATKDKRTADKAILMAAKQEAAKAKKDEANKVRAEKAAVKAEAKRVKDEEKKRVADRQAEEKAQDAERKATDRGRFGKSMDAAKSKLGSWKDKVKEKLPGQPKKEKGWMGMLLGTLMTFGAWLVKGIGGIMGKVMWGVGKFIVGNLGKALLSFAGNGLIGKAASGIGSMLLRGAIGMGATTLGAAASGAWAAAGVVAGAVAVPALVIGGTALAAYGGYKLWQKYKRGKISELDKWRFQHYGFGFKQKDHFDTLKKTEELLKGYLEQGRTEDKERYTLKRFDEKMNEAITEIYGLTNEPADKERIVVFRKWLNARFIPVFLEHTNAVNAAKKGLYLADVEDLTPTEKLSYVKTVNIQSTVYDCKITPFKDYETIEITKADCDNTFEYLISDLTPKAKFEEEQKKTIRQGPLKGAPPSTTPAGSKPPTTAKTDATSTAPASKPPAAVKPTEETPSPDGGEKAQDNKNSSSSASKPATTTSTTPAAAGPLSTYEGSMVGINVQKGVKVQGIDKNLMDLFGGMASEYNKLTGKNITITSGYRTREDQVRIAKQKPGYAASPGNSPHNFGLALDIAPNDANTLEKMGLLKKYGFTRPIGEEDWHIEAAGTTLTNDIVQRSKNDLAFRAIAITGSPGRGGGGYGVTPGSKKPHRNYPLQEKLFRAGGDVPIDNGPKDDEVEIKPPAASTPSSNKPEKTAPASTSAPASAPTVTPSASKSEAVTASKKPEKTASTSAPTVMPTETKKVVTPAASTPTASAPAPAAKPAPAKKEEPAQSYPTTVVAPMVTKATVNKPQEASASASTNALASTQMANVMDKQLSALNKIVELLNSIDGKFDIKALAGAIQAKPASAPPPPENDPPRRGHVVGTKSTSAVSMSIRSN